MRKKNPKRELHSPVLEPGSPDLKSDALPLSYWNLLRKVLHLLQVICTSTILSSEDHFSH